MTAPPLILASTSAARRAMLSAAGVPFTAHAPGVDEDALKASLRAAEASPRDIADALAEAKAVKLSRRMPQALVLGADQVLDLKDGSCLDKPASVDEARAQLQRLRGAAHKLISAAVIAENGVAVWRLIDHAELTMRAFSDGFLDAYVSREGDALLSTVGGYRIEGHGAQLFARVRGDHFTIQGLPMFGLLDYLRIRGVLPT